MNNQNPGFLANRNRLLTPILFLATLITGALFIWWTVQRANRDMLDSLLQKTRLVAQAMDIERIKALSGTEADLDNPSYRLLKEQLTAIRSANPSCRFVYLMGRNADGAIFFFVDSEPANSKDYSPPGQVYKEASEEDYAVFDNRTADASGPYPDRWGTWVSSSVPVIDLQTDAVVAVLGMDIDASTWLWDVATQAAVPVGLMLLLLIGVAIVFFSARRVDTSPRPILWRLLPSLAVIVTLLIVGVGAILNQQHHLQLDVESAANISDVSGDLQAALGQQAIILAMVAQPIAADPGVQLALREGDADQLLLTWRPVFETMNRENLLTHFYFYDKNRVCLLRVHDPERRGGIINHLTALEAERTGKVASGIELGSLGTFTMRVVQPVFEGGTLVGYVELGKEIEDVLQTMHTRSGNQLAVTIRKEYLNRQTWEDGMRLLGREADWDRLSQSVVVYASQGRLPDAFASWADQFTRDPVHRETDREIVFDGKDWRVSSTPLQDISGKEVGDLLVMRDISIEHADFARLQTMERTAGAVLLALLLGFIYVLLRRTDSGIRAQQAALRQSEEKFRGLFESSHDALVTLAPPTWTFTSGNPASLAMFGAKSVEEFISHTIVDLSPAQQLDGRVSAEKAKEMIEKAMSEGSRFFDWTHKRIDGEEFPATVLLTRTQFAGKQFLQATVRDITESRRDQDKLVQHLEREERIVDLGRELAGTLEMEAICQIVANSLNKMIDSPVIGIELVDPDLSALKVAFLVEDGKRIDTEHLATLPYHPDNPTDGRSLAIVGKKAVIISDPESRLKEENETLIGGGRALKCAIYIPMVTEERVNGLLYLTSSHENAFTEEDVGWLEGVANLVGLALENARLYIEAQRTAVAEERNRLAGELHDAVSQTLFSSNITAASLLNTLESDPTKLRAGLVRLQQLNGGALAEMRTLLMELRPATLLKTSLKVLLTQLAGAVAGRSPIEIMMHVDDVPTLPSDVHIALYRITQEAINNVIKYADAKQIVLTLRTSGTGVDLQIADNGCGYDPDQITAEHQGLQIMRERAEKLGMNLDIKTTIGQGTQVNVRWSSEEHKDMSWFGKV